VSVRKGPHDLLSYSLYHCMIDNALWYTLGLLACPQYFILNAALSSLFAVTYGYISDCYQIGPDFVPLLYLYAEMQSIASPSDESLSWVADVQVNV
jgi:hypothetical protein